MSVEKEIRKILGEATPAATRAKQELVRSGLGHDKNAAAVMAALKDPEAAMANPAKRDMLLKVMQDLLDVVVNDPSMVSKTKTALRKEEIEELDEKLHPNQKKLDKNKNGKLDAEDFKKLRGEAKKPKAEDDEEEENEKEDEDEKELEDDEIENEKEDEKEDEDEDEEDKEEMLAKMKNGKSFKAFMKKEGYVSHAQRKAVWASRNDEKEALKRKMKKEEIQLEQAPVAPALVKHRIAVTVSEPDHTMVSKRKEQVLKHVVIPHGPDKKSAQKLGEKFYKKRGYKVHGSEHVGIKEEVQLESVTTDYKLVKGQTQNKTPSEKLATDYKLTTKKVAKVNEAKDPREYDYEGDMAKSQLRSIIANAKQAHDMLKDDTNMAEWVQSKITLAADYISTVADYMQSEVNEEREINESGGPVVFKKGEHHVEKYSDDSFALYKLGKKQKFYPTLAAAKTAMKEDIQIDEVGPFSYGAKAPRKGTVAYNAMMKRKEQEKGKQPIEPKDQMVGNAKVTKEETQIDELKKSTLGSYVKKASKEYGRDKQLVGRESPSGMVKDARPEVKAKLKNRMAGIEKAADRLAKEDVQVDEAFPTVADARKRMKDALKSKFDKKKISTGTVYTRKYKEDKEDDEKKSNK
jgi:hypothetical protein